MLWTLIGSFIVLVNACNRKDIVVQQTLAADTKAAEPLVVRQSSVIFLRLSQQEYDILSQEHKYEMIEIVRDFEYYINKISGVFKKNGIDSTYVSSKKLIFMGSNGKEEQLTFNSKKYPVAFALFGKGKKPKIYYGIVLDADILKIASEYFEINLKQE